MWSEILHENKAVSGIGTARIIKGRSIVSSIVLKFVGNMKMFLFYITGRICKLGLQFVKSKQIKK